MAWFPRAIVSRSALLVPVFLSAACMMHGGFHDCPEGQALTDGQCVPTSSIVFQRCIDSFRKSTEQRDEGTDTQLGADVSGYGGGQVRHARKDHQEASYDALPEEVVPEAIAECRRQEQAEREQQVQKAWAAADAARQRAAQAEGRVREAKRETAKVTASLAQVETERDTIADERDGLDVALADLQARFDEQAALIADKHPCTAGDWARCGRQALAAKRSGDYDQAHDLYRQSCDGGDAESCGNWGVMFEHGLGTAASPRQAQARYAAACQLDHALSCFNEARMLELASEPEAALERYESACEGEEMHACARLGTLYESGTGTEVDLGAARRHYASACEADLPEACAGLAELYEQGRGVKADRKRAATLFERACDAGEDAGCQGAERLSRQWESGDSERL